MIKNKIPGTRNFIYEEFFSKRYYNRFKARPYWLFNRIDYKIPILCQIVRDRFKKPVIINNWKWANKKEQTYNFSGFRSNRCKVGATFSRHRLGLCADIKVIDIPAPEVQEDMIKNFDIYKESGLTAIEADTLTWTHISAEKTDWIKQNGIWIIPKPKKTNSKR